MSQLLPSPPIEPFERLRAADGLLINAERWRRAHEYHRQRQNLHYQALHQPGVVCGLGVKIIASDSTEPNQYRDGRGVQLQPGIAIDLQGNPIVVPQPENVQIGVEPLADEPLTVYLVVSYRDPEDLAIREGQEMMREQFRIDVKTKPPDPLEVEVCRLLLPPGQPLRLVPAADVFFPSYHNLDFRFRIPAGIRPEAMVRIAQIKHGDPDHNRNFINLDYLLKATVALYPRLQGVDPVGLVTWEDSNLEQYDLLYLTGQQLHLNQRELAPLKRYLNRGGVLLVDSPNSASELSQNISTLAQQHLGISLQPLSRRHYLRRYPFLFAALPHGGDRQPIEILAGGGLIVTSGNLGGVWGLDDALSLPRETIRAAQELGINILYYAWQRSTMTKLQTIAKS